MEKHFGDQMVDNNRGQSTVEYILLLAVITSLAFAILNNPKFKAFIAGQDGLFAIMRGGMSYSYRYGVQYQNSISLQDKQQFNYTTHEHDTYYQNGNSRFFTGAEAYP